MTIGSDLNSAYSSRAAALMHFLHRLFQHGQ